MPKIKELIWSSSFKRAFKKHVVGKYFEKTFPEKVELFVENPFNPLLKTHKLSGNLSDLWSFAVAYDCRIIFKFLSDKRVLFIDIGTHDEVY
jgi:addiction module RelE/StbE family toxin